MLPCTVAVMTEPSTIDPEAAVLLLRAVLADVRRPLRKAKRKQAEALLMRLEVACGFRMCPVVAAQEREASAAWKTLTASRQGVR